MQCRKLERDSITVVFFCWNCQIFKNSFYRTPLVAASENVLLNSSLRFSYLNECLWTFQISCSEKYTPVSWAIHLDDTSSIGGHASSLHIYDSVGTERIFNNLAKTWNLQHYEIIVECKLVYLKRFHITCCLIG